MKTSWIANHKFWVLLSVTVVLLVVLALQNSASAQGTQTPPSEATTSSSVSQTGNPNTGSLDIKDNPIYVRLIEIINFLSVGVTAVTTISVIIAGLQYSFSRGDPSATSASVKRLVHAATALGMYVFGWSILNWLIPGGVLN